jgi:hypothetical protein
MNTLLSWIIGGLMGLLGILGLFLSSRTEDPVMYATGLAVFVFTVLFCFALIGGFGRRGGA